MAPTPADSDPDHPEPHRVPQQRPRLSLRSRLLAGMGLVAVVLVAAAVVVTRTTESYLLDQVDEQLVRSGGPRVPWAGGGPEPQPAPPEGTDPNRAPSNVYVGVVSGDGLQAVALPNLTTDSPLVPDIGAAEARAAAADGRAPFTVGSVDGDVRYRVIARQDDRLGEVVVVGLQLADVDAAVGRLVWVEVVATVVALLVLALVTWWVIRLGVRPVKRMTAAATAIAGGDLSGRIPAAEPGTEAADLGDALNRMLGTIDRAFAERAASEDRLRRFVADASHELRTPVTTIRGYAELYRAGGLGDPDQLDAAMRRTEQESVRMGNLVADMLQLARLDQGRELDRVPLRLDAMASDAVLDARAVQPGRPVSLDAVPATVLGDEDRVRQVIANLVGNALVHTPPGAPITVRVAPRPDEHVVLLEVVDGGPGMPPEVAAHAFERFYRADPSRSRHQGGSGLGLSIAQAVVTALGGAVELETAPGAGTTVRVTLPLAPGGTTGGTAGGTVG